jgi:hypothetical protein
VREDIKTDVFKQYETGRQYKQKIDLYNAVTLAIRMLQDDQWIGVESAGLPLPVLNFLKRVRNSQVPKVAANNIKMLFTPNGVSMDKNDIESDKRKLSEAMAMSMSMQPNPTGRITDEEKKAVAQLFTAYSDKSWENLDMVTTLLSVVSDAFATGDGILYFYYDDEIETGQTVKGDLNKLILDNVNVYFGNPTCHDKEKQPYIIIAQRENLQAVKAEALKNGASQLEVDSITGDSDNQDQAGDKGKIELDDNNMCLTLLKLWREKEKGKSKIYACKSTKSCIVRPKWYTKFSKYPLAIYNWDERKNCIHGNSEITGLIPNQIAVNKVLAFDIISTMNTAYPKVIIDENYVDGFSNAVGAVIPVRDGVDGKIKYLDAPQNSGEALRLVTYIIDQTMQLMGANDASLGNSPSDNTSALMFNAQQANEPLKEKQKRLYKFIKDIGRIWVDFWVNYYNAERFLTIEDDDGTYYAPFDGRRYQNVMFDLKIQVGQALEFSEALLEQGLKSAMQYVKLDPEIYLMHSPNIFNREAILSDYRKIKAESLQQMQAQGQGTPPPSQLPM